MIVTSLNYDSFYFEQLLVLMTSLKINSPEDRMMVYLINFPDDVIRKIKKLYPYEFVSKTLNFKENTDVAGIMVCYRTLVLKECINKYNEPVAWFDTDVIVRGSLMEFWSDIKPNSLKIMVRDSKKNSDKFQAGIFAVGKSEITQKYIGEWNREVQKENKWFSDQRILYLMYNKYKHKIDLINMPVKFNDVGKSDGKCFMEDSINWHCKKPHFYKEPFRSEYLNYLQESESIK